MHAYPLQVALNLHLPRFEILDVGARGEGEERYAAFVAKGWANVSGFEADVEEYERLCAAKAPSYRYFPHCLGKGGPAVYHRTRYPGCSSLYEPDPKVINLFSCIEAGAGGNFEVVEKRDVDTTRLDDIADCPPPDYAKLDVQGGELDVLQGATKTLASALVLEVEVEFVPLYKGQPLFADVQAFLKQQGFQLHKFLDLSGRCFRPLGRADNPHRAMSQLLWADAVFVRDFASLQDLTTEQLLKTAVLLHDLYYSYDLVHLFLSEYDRRSQTTLADRYTRSVLSLPNLPVMYLTVKQQP